MTQLHTTDKTSLVNALNEVKDNSSTTAEDTTYTDTYNLGADNVQDALDAVATETATMKDIIGEGYYESVADVDLSVLTVQNCSLGANKKWYMGGARGRHIAVPVTQGQRYRLALLSSGTSFYGFVTSSYAPPYATNATVPYADGGDRNAITMSSGVIEVTPTENAAYLILTKVDGAGVTHEWSLQTVDDIDPTEVESIDSRLKNVEDISDTVNGTPTEVLKELQWNDYAYQTSNTRIYAYLKDTVQEGDIVTVNCTSIENYQYDLLIMSTGTWGGSASIIWQSGWVSDTSYSKTIDASEAGYYIRIQFRDADEASIAGQIPTIKNIFEVSYRRAYIESINGLVQYVGQPPLDVADQIDLSGITESPRSLGSTTWWLNSSNPVQSHIAVPVEPQKGYRIQFDANTQGGDGFWAFVNNTYTPPTSNGAIPFAEGQTSRNALPIGEYVDTVAPSDAAYLILTIVDGGGGRGTWELFQLAPTLKKSLFESVEELENAVGFAKVRVASWNLGHFSLGASSDTRITHDNYEEMRQKWAERINEIDADIFCCCEYNTNFVNASGDDAAISARDAIFSLYRNASIGAKNSYNQNAMFANVRFTGFKSVNFDNRTQARYYIVNTVNIGGKDIKVVATHLDFNQDSTGQQNRALQMQQLISDFANDEYVIICADWNTSDGGSEFDVFANAGYKMANHGYLGDMLTYPAGDTQTSILDNIVVKGFAVNGIHLVNDATLTDHFAVYCDLTIIPNN